MKKTIFGLLTSFTILSAAQAQSDADLLNFNMTQNISTARTTAFAGAGGSYGQDFGALSINPASIGFYRSSELIFSPNLKISNTKTDYINSNTKGNNTKFSVGNIGYVGAHVKKKYSTNDAGEKIASDKGQWAWAFGMNKTADFNRTYKMGGMNRNNSFINTVLSATNQGSGYTTAELASFFPYDASLAYDAYLIDPYYIGDTTYYTSALQDGGMNQNFQVREKGAINEMLGTIGGNFNNRLYIGATITVPFMHYSQKTSYSESNDSNYVSGITDYTFNQNLNISSTGFGAKLGAILRVNDYIRIGAAAHTPVVSTVSDIYGTTLTSNTAAGNSQSLSSESTNSLRYRITSPWHYLASATLMYPKKGFVTMDYEMIAYDQMEINFIDNVSGSFENNINTNITNKYKSASNIKIGAEYVLDKNLALRGGIAFLGTPFQDTAALNGYDQSRKVYSAGIGYRNDGYFLDLTYSTTRFSKNYNPYVLSYESVPNAWEKANLNNVVLSMGVRF